MASSSRLAAENPIARILPLLDVPHLDRGFDYSVPAELAEDTSLNGLKIATIQEN